MDEIDGELQQGSLFEDVRLEEDGIEKLENMDLVNHIHLIIGSTRDKEIAQRLRDKGFTFNELTSVASSICRFRKGQGDARGSLRRMLVDLIKLESLGITPEYGLRGSTLNEERALDNKNDQEFRERVVQPYLVFTRCPIFKDSVNISKLVFKKGRGGRDTFIWSRLIQQSAKEGTELRVSGNLTLDNSNSYSLVGSEKKIKTKAPPSFTFIRINRPIEMYHHTTGSFLTSSLEGRVHTGKMYLRFLEEEEDLESIDYFGSYTNEEFSIDNSRFSDPESWIIRAEGIRKFLFDANIDDHGNIILST